MAILDSVKNVISGGAKSVGNLGSSALDLLNPSKARGLISGLLPGGGRAQPTVSPVIGFQNTEGVSEENDWRVKISLSPNNKIFYQSVNNELLRPLQETNGVIFPYLPTINVQHSASYSDTALTHSNQNMQFYQNSTVQEISISGEFTVQSAEEGQYLLAAIYFFRSCTKMFFGQGDNAGNPPPIVFLDGYGSHYFPHVPCVMSGFTHILPDNVDYVPVPVTKTTLEEQDIEDLGNYGSVNDSLGPRISPDFGSKKATGTTKLGYSSMTTATRLPTASTLTINLRPVYSRKNLHDNFDLHKFANGDLLGDKNRGGFL